MFCNNLFPANLSQKCIKYENKIIHKIEIISDFHTTQSNNSLPSRVVFYLFSIQSKNRVTSVRVVKMESLRNKYRYHNFANSFNFQDDLSGFDLTSAASHGSYGGHS